jgi:hypothetical protein
MWKYSAGELAPHTIATPYFGEKIANICAEILFRQPGN